MNQNHVEEVPINKDVKPGQRVVIAQTDPRTYQTTYAFAQVTRVSFNKTIVTVANADILSMRFHIADGTLYTSNIRERPLKRLLQATDDLVYYMQVREQEIKRENYRHQVLSELRQIIWEVENTAVLENVLLAYKAGRALVAEAEELY